MLAKPMYKSLGILGNHNSFFFFFVGKPVMETGLTLGDHEHQLFL